MNLKKILDSDRDSSKSSVFLMVRYEMPEVVKSLQAQLTSDDLYIDPSDPINGFGLELESHVTLFPCLDEEVSIKDLSQYLPDVGLLQIQLGNISLFEQENYNVLKADVILNSPIHALNEELSKHFTSHSEYKEFHPHMTIAYIKKDSPANQWCRTLVDEPVLVPLFYDYSWDQDGKYKHVLFNVK